jgi:hypothetical protein
MITFMQTHNITA